ncbi:MAG TPA: C25 family cysteine peptidase, partial [Blastocatellia bacterium]|nr:C25 family cysteine peptidase [Blastocatellia bacterium]
MDNLGYNVYREVNGRRTRITPQIIGGSALITGPRVALTAGNSYAWADEMIPGARYWLEDIDLEGKSTLTGPITLSSVKAANTAKSQLLSKVGFTQSGLSGQDSIPSEHKAEISPATAAALKPQSDLARGPAVKISVRQEGWYRLPLADLVAAGLDPMADARNLQLFADGQEVPIIVTNPQGRLDTVSSVEFYGVGLNSPSTDTRVYWLVSGSQPGLRVKNIKGNGGSPVDAFPFTVERRDRTLYFAALRNGESENFFGPVIGSSGVDQTVRLSKVASALSNQPATLEVAVQGVTNVAHSIRINLNGADVGKLSFNGQTRATTNLPVPQTALRDGDNVVRLLADGGAADVSLTEAIRVTYLRKYSADSNQLRFKASGGQQVSLGGFTNSPVRVMDVTDPSAVTELVSAPASGKTGGLVVSIPGNGERTLLAFTPDRARAAEMTANAPSNWRIPEHSADYLAVTRKDLLASLEPLLSARRNQGLSTALVDIEDVYDEFSFGNASPQALKDFLAYAKTTWNQAPRYVLLAGDGTFDPKGYLGIADGNVLPAKLIDTQHLETVSDDWFVGLGDEGLPTMSIGRLPVRNSSEAARLVAKIAGYEASTPANSVLLVSDSSEGYDFATDSNRLRPYITAGTTVSEIKRGTADDAEIRKKLITSISTGQKLVNYDGHGSMNQWRGNLLTGDDANALTNRTSLSLFVMMNCLNAYFVDPLQDSLAERLLRSDGGAFAVWASTGQTEPFLQSVMSQEFYKQLFGGLTIGEAAARAKAAVSDADI